MRQTIVPKKLNVYSRCFKVVPP